TASLNGLVAWAASRAAEYSFALIGRDGRRIRQLDIAPGDLSQQALSPDGTRLLFVRAERGSADIFVHDLRTSVTERLTTDPEYDELPAWTPNGRAMTYLGRENGQRTVIRLEIGSGAHPIKLASTANVFSSGAETPDGRYVLFSVTTPNA